MLAKFYLLAKLEASVMSNITQPLPKPTSVSSALFFTLPGLSSFPFLSHYLPPSQTILQTLGTLASRSDTYFL